MLLLKKKRIFAVDHAPYNQEQQSDRQETGHASEDDHVQIIKRCVRLLGRLQRRIKLCPDLLEDTARNIKLATSARKLQDMFDIYQAVNHKPMSLDPVYANVKRRLDATFGLADGSSRDMLSACGSGARVGLC